MIKNFQHTKEAKTGDWQCVVVQEPWDFNVKIYLMFTGNGKKQIASVYNGGILLTDYEEESVNPSKPFLTMPVDSWQTLLQCMSGIVPDEEEIETGSELKATKYHLQDLRKLLKL